MKTLKSIASVSVDDPIIPVSDFKGIVNDKYATNTVVLFNWGVKPMNALGLQFSFMLGIPPQMANNGAKVLRVAELVAKCECVQAAPVQATTNTFGLVCARLNSTFIMSDSYTQAKMQLINSLRMCLSSDFEVMVTE
jgi:hypothetical protein